MQPIGYVDEEILEYIRDNVMKCIGVLIELSGKTFQLKNDFLNKMRNQYLAEPIFHSLKRTVNGYDIVLGIADIDAYSYGYNFIFGIAGHNIALVFLRRLRPEFWGDKPDKHKFFIRILKECLHELGHAFGLMHCRNPRCVMRFSNTIMDTDFKRAAFCMNCSRRLEAIGVKVYSKII